METRKYIPKYLNAEPQILWWDLSEFMIFLVILSIGILGDFPFSATLFGALVLKLSGKLFNKKEPGFVKHLAYSKGLYGIKGRVPEFWIKEFGR